MSPYEPHEDDPDPDFSDEDERLFRRVGDADLSGGVLMFAAIDLPDHSVDRERYREDPDDVYADHAGELPHIVSAPVMAFDQVQATNHIERELRFRAQLPQESPDDALGIVAELAHCPMAENYAHTEVRIRRAGRPFDRNWKPNSTKRKMLIRTRIAALFTPLD